MEADYVQRFHRHQPKDYQSSATVMKHIKASTDIQESASWDCVPAECGRRTEWTTAAIVGGLGGILLRCVSACPLSFLRRWRIDK
ncbi:hypothetical protein DM860_013389 [Cuscuta australis]|uniref:Uncharacterized protein n=1 Tax=Cuscuta australis TaxID=267555 RepID=A0A328DP83_9ASTE|nr:hypothetical protein DM860_013389 [Cuscuta australis]